MGVEITAYVTCTQVLYLLTVWLNGLSAIQGVMTHGQASDMYVDRSSEGNEMCYT